MRCHRSSEIHPQRLRGCELKRCKLSVVPCTRSNSSLSINILTANCCSLVLWNRRIAIISLIKVKARVSKSGLFAHLSKPAHTPAMSQTLDAKSTQATSGGVDGFGQDSATVHVAAYNPSSADLDRHYGSGAICIQNKAGQDVSQSLFRPPGSSFVLEAPKYNTVPVRSDVRYSPSIWEQYQTKIDRSSERLGKGAA